MEIGPVTVKLTRAEIEEWLRERVASQGFRIVDPPKREPRKQKEGKKKKEKKESEPKGPFIWKARGEIALMAYAEPDPDYTPVEPAPKADTTQPDRPDNIQPVDLSKMHEMSYEEIDELLQSNARLSARQRAELIALRDQKQGEKKKTGSLDPTMLPPGAAAALEDIPDEGQDD